ncbi:MAG: HAMP domain-containing protein [Dehalococcoidales bacterium]|nr:HAMP domain-containing protein [Dehalococcoidales bacterium]
MRLLKGLFPKLAVTILLICVVPLIAVSVIVLNTASGDLREETFNHLESASIQKSRMNDILDSYRDSVALITSRTQLRKDLALYLETSDPSLQERMTAILFDARDSIDDLLDIHVFSTDGYVLASTDEAKLGTYMIHEKCVNYGLTNNDIRGLFRSSDDAVYAHLSGPILFDGVVTGVIVIDIQAEKINHMIQDYSGLQTTGETLFAHRDENGDALFIHPLRFDPDAALKTVVSHESTELPITQALLKNEIFIDDAEDYRGKEVLAVTRYLESVDWGMVVKIDRDEALAPIADLRNTLTVINILVFVVIVCTSLYWARRLSRPVSELTQTAIDFGRGDLKVRSAVSSSDEIGTLAKSFNRMADNILEHQDILETRVRERTRLLQEEIEERKQVEQALKLSERNFRLSIEESPLPISITDYSLVSIYGNQALLDLFGYSRLEEFSEIPIKDRYTDESLALLEKITGSYLKDPMHLEANEIDIIRKNGDMRHAEIYTKDILWDNQHMIQVIFSDLTEIRKKQEVIISQDRLASLGQLVSGVAHELNNPLTGIIGMTDLLLMEDLPENIADDIQIINREAHRTADIVKNLLTFSQKQRDKKIPVDINEVISTVIRLRNNEIKMKNIELSLQLASSLPPVSGNASQLHQVIYNIIINAEYFMEKANHGGNLTVTTRENKDKVEVVIHDDGPGISDDILPMILNPFFTTKDVGEGTGLGLSISYGIIKDHNGTLKVESKNGDGTTFIIELPAAE